MSRSGLVSTSDSSFKTIITHFFLQTIRTTVQEKRSKEKREDEEVEAAKKAKAEVDDANEVELQALNQDGDSEPKVAIVEANGTAHEGWSL